MSGPETCVIEGIGYMGNISTFGGTNVTQEQTARTWECGISIRCAGFVLGAAALGTLGFNPSADAKGTFTTFDPRGSINTYAIGINDKGALAGFYQGSDYARHGFVRHPNGSITVFDA